MKADERCCTCSGVANQSLQLAVVFGMQVWTQLMTDVAADPWMSANVIFDILKCDPCSSRQHGVLGQRRPARSPVTFVVWCWHKSGRCRRNDANVLDVLTCCRPVAVSRTPTASRGWAPS